MPVQFSHCTSHIPPSICATNALRPSFPAYVACIFFDRLRIGERFSGVVLRARGVRRLIGERFTHSFLIKISKPDEELCEKSLGHSGGMFRSPQ